MAADGLSWLVLTGTLGFEYWVLEVAQEMKTEYGFQLVTILLLKPMGKIGLKPIR